MRSSNDTSLRAAAHAVADDVPAAQQMLLDILDTVREPLLVLDPEFRVLQANRSFFRTFKVEPNDTIGEVLFELGDGQWDIAPLRQLLRDKLTVEPEQYDVDVDHVFPAIGRKVMQLNARLVSRWLGAPRIILLAIEDITERRSTEWRLADQRRELERSNAALDEFAGVASHDLQEPLRKIMSFGERLNNSVGHRLDGDAKHYLERMLSAAGRMRSLISDLLSYSQITTREQPFVATDLGEVARGVMSDLETSVADAHAEVQIGALPVIQADESQMRQLLQNLLANALKYRRKDTPSVIHLSATSRDGQHHDIIVRDNGIGFNQEYAERIFKTFERLHGRGQYEGSGIGLAICRKIVERHGGRISAKGTVGEGATFTVTLPSTQAATGFFS